MKRNIFPVVVINLLVIVEFVLFVWWTQPPFNLPPDNSTVLNKTICDCSDEFRDIQEDVKRLRFGLAESSRGMILTISGIQKLDQENRQALTNQESRLQQQISDLHEISKKQAKEIKDLKWAVWGGCR